MPSERNNSRLMSRVPPVATPGDQQEQLPCPRCDSTNTKFCYYNNYNFSQPRHFCKACRRYWTHGGTLRDIPVGGVSRKTTKRSRPNSSSSSASSSSAVVGSRNVPLQATPVIFPQMSSNCGNMAARGSASVPSLYGGFTSLLNSNAGLGRNVPNVPTGGFHGLEGFSLGIEHGSFFDDVRFGQGITAWPFSAGVADAASTTSHVAPMPTTWQFDFEGSENKVGFVSVPGVSPPQ